MKANGQPDPKVRQDCYYCGGSLQEVEYIPHSGLRKFECQDCGADGEVSDSTSPCGCVFEGGDEE